ncbi:MAG: DNA polymerase I [Oscillospiraceae bacterium]|nr:DNA polymerase I [Oscillospiraceae bacterium]
MEKLVLIDGNSILNRAFYGIMASKMLSTPDGTPTNAVYGFLAIMFKLLEDIHPEYVTVAFDVKAKTKRHLMYEGYKATRKGMPDELACQMPIIKEILKSMNIEVIEKEGYEADDVLGTLAKTGAKENLDVTILTGDRDAFQLAQENITIRIPRTKMGQTEVEDFDFSKIMEQYGVEPKQLIDVKGLMGDASDNIPGIQGIGEKTALQLIKDYGSIEELYNKLPENPKITGKLREKLESGKDSAFMSKELGTIDINVEIDRNIEDLKTKDWNKDEVYSIFKRLKFNRYIERFNLSCESNDGNKEISIIVEKAENIESIVADIEKNKRVFIYFDTVEDNNPELIINKKINAVYMYSETESKAYWISILHTVVDEINVGENNVRPEPSDFNAIKRILENPQILKIGYKLKENYIILKEQGIEAKNMMFDVGVAGYILNSTSNNYNITNLMEIYLNIDINDNSTKHENTNVQMNLFNMAEIDKNESNSSQKPDETKGVYAFGIYSLYKVLTEKLIETSQIDLLNNIEMPLLEVLAEMQYNGIYVDKEELEKFGAKLQVRIDELTVGIYKMCGEEFNLNSPKQLGEVLFEKLKLPTKKKTKTGYSTDVDVLEKLSKEHSVIELILEYRQLMKLKSTYVIGLIPYINPRTKRIHSVFHQTVTSTGRISSSDPNLQNIPTRVELGKQLRKAFKADEGSIFVNADYSQIELRILAHIADDKTMKSAFENDEDIHKQVASYVLKIPMEQVTKEQRGQAKAVNFGIVYGISDFGLSEQLKISKKSAKEYIEQYLEKYNGIKQFMADVVEKTKANGYVETLFNRRRPVPELNSNSYVVRQFGERVAMNTPIQGTAADIMKIAMINIYKELKKAGLKAKIVLQVHDEIMVETPESEIEAVKQIIVKEMENAANLSVRLKVDLEQGTSWYDAK